MADSAPALPAAAAAATAATAADTTTTVAGSASAATASSKVPPHPTFNDPTITTEEKASLAKLRAALVDYKHAAGILYSLDTRLVKYLRARGGDVRQAAKFFTEALEYRQKNGFMTDTLLAEFKPPNEICTHVCKYPVPFFHRKDGGLVLYVRSGLLHGWKLCKKLGKETVCKTFAWYLEHMTRTATANISKYPKTAPYFTFIFDLTGFGSHCFGPLDCTKALVNVFQNLYPESLKKCILVNCPWIFRLGWRLISPFVDPAVNEKILILKGPASERIFEFVNPEQVPVFMGGKMTEDGDEYCGKSIVSCGDPYAEEK